MTPARRRHRPDHRVSRRNLVDPSMRGRGHAEGRRETTADAKFSDTELAAEDARRQAKDAQAWVRWHGRKSHAGRATKDSLSDALRVRRVKRAETY
jgi:hypothetical protein